MARQSVGQIAGAVALIGLLLAGAAALQRIREQRYAAPVVSEDALYLTSGTMLKRVTAGYNALAADLYWIRTIQYYGGVKLRLDLQPPTIRAGEPLPTEYPLLYPMLDLTTTLDPRFNIAYRFGAIFLAEPLPGGAGRPDLAVALLEKGLRERPDKWEYMQDIGFVHYWWRHDYQAAAEWFTRAGEVPGAPWWLLSLAATTLAEGGDRQSSRTMWEAIRQSAEIDWLRRDAERRLLQLRAMDEIDALQVRLDRAIQESGQQPSEWTPDFRDRVVRSLPSDPGGTRYEVDESGRIRLSRRSMLFPLPDEPKALVPPS